MAEFTVKRADGSVAGFDDPSKADTYARSIGSEVVELAPEQPEQQPQPEQPQQPEWDAPVTAD